MQFRGRNYSTATILLAAFCLIFTLAALIFAYQLSQPEADAAIRAEDSGQRVVYDIKEEKVLTRTPPVLEAMQEQQAAAADTPKPDEQGTTAESPPADSTATPASPPTIALIISGVGISRSSTTATFNLPIGISVSISPYSNSAKEIMDNCKKTGREYLAEFQMEPIDYPFNDVGPLAMLTKNETVENLSRMEAVLAKIPGAAAALTPIDEKFLASGEPAKQIIVKLSEKNIPLIIGNVSHKAAPPEALSTSTIPVIYNSMVVDSTIDSAAIGARLAEVESLAREQGFAVAIARPYPITLRAVSKWAETIEDRGFKLAPPSTLVPAKPAEPVETVLPNGNSEHPETTSSTPEKHADGQ